MTRRKSLLPSVSASSYLRDLLRRWRVCPMPARDPFQTKLPFANQFLRTALTFVARHVSLHLAREHEDDKLPGQSITPPAGGEMLDKLGSQAAGWAPCRGDESLAWSGWPVHSCRRCLLPDGTIGTGTPHDR